MTARVKAVLTPAALKRWNAIALTQLAEACARLAAENEDLRCRLARAESNADDCWQQAMDMQMQLCEMSGSQPGLTQSGALVVVSVPAGAQP